MMCLTSGYILYWLLGVGYIFSNGDIVEKKGYPFVDIQISENLKTYLYLHGFALFWNLAFLLTVSNFVISGAVCLWYHREHPDRKNMVMMSIWWMVRYHIGTVAFGSLILSIVWVLRVIAEYIDVSTLTAYLIERSQEVKGYRVRPEIHRLLPEMPDCLFGEDSEVLKPTRLC